MTLARRGTFTPGDKPERPADKQLRRRNLRRVGGLFRAHRARLGAVLGLIFLSAGLGMVSPFLLRAVLDDAIPSKDTTQLTLLVAGMIAIAIVTGALGVAQTWLSNSVGQRVMHDRAPRSTAICSGCRWPSSRARAPARCRRGSRRTSAAS